MIKRVIIAGCRDYENYSEAKNFINLCLSNIKNGNEIIILSVGCKGADKLGERYAEEIGYRIEVFPAEWEKYSKKAGLKRNEEMSMACDCAVIFWDGKSKGTRSMINLARKHNKPIRIKRIKPMSAHPLKANFYLDKTISLLDNKIKKHFDS